jgi:hypothetical protein
MIDVLLSLTSSHGTIVLGWAILCALANVPSRSALLDEARLSYVYFILRMRPMSLE